MDIEQYALRLYISIHTLHTEGDRINASRIILSAKISIHTLHTEGDLGSRPPGSLPQISIHTLHTEGDWINLPSFPADIEFQSTPSTRRVTRSTIACQIF